MDGPVKPDQDNQKWQMAGAPKCQTSYSIDFTGMTPARALSSS